MPKPILIEFNGKIASVAEHCRDLGIKVTTVQSRHYRTGESYKECLQHYKENGVQYQNRVYKIKSRALYTRWHDMKSRCYNPNNPMYHRYGGIGVKVWDRWHIYENFENDLLESFLEHIEKYGLIDTTLDRFPNKEGNYEPANIRWATRKEQANNLTTNRIVMDNLTLSQFSEKYNINKSTVRQRLEQGWTIEEIIHTPVQQHESYYLPCNNYTKLLYEHCNENGYEFKPIYYYIKRYNLQPHEALAKWLENNQENVVDKLKIICYNKSIKLNNSIKRERLM